MNALRRIALRFALGWGQYEYMVRVLNTDQRCGSARMVDIVVRKDGVERRIEADFLKGMARLVRGCQKPIGPEGWMQKLLHKRLRWAP